MIGGINCSELEDILERIFRIPVDVSKLEQWVNGGEFEYVELGGKMVPTIRNLVRQIDERESQGALDKINEAKQEIGEIALKLQKKIAELKAMTATAETLPPGSQATAFYNPSTGEFQFGIPEGIQGIQGERGIAPWIDIIHGGDPSDPAVGIIFGGDPAMTDTFDKTYVRQASRIGTSAQWESVNPILADGELGYERTTNGKLLWKIGDGKTPWNNLAYPPILVDTIYRFRGSVNTVADLPKNAEHGDVWNVKATGANYAWTGSEWDNLGVVYEMDSAPKSGSSNPVTSDGLYTAFGAITDNVTTILNANRKVVAKDLAIGGNASDLLSQRGFVGEPKSVGGVNLTSAGAANKQGIYHVNSGGTTGCPTWALPGEEFIVGGSAGHGLMHIRSCFSGANKPALLLRGSSIANNVTTWTAWEPVITQSMLGTGLTWTGNDTTYPTIRATDIAIGNSASDLASQRGCFGKPYSISGQNFDSITKEGKYALSSGGTSNAPSGFQQTILRVDSRIVADESSTITQLCFDTALPRIAMRNYRGVAAPKWSAWSECLMSGRIGDGIKVTNGIPSVPQYTGATASAAGVAGLVPPATAAQRTYFLCADGTWKLIDVSSAVSNAVLLTGNQTIAGTKTFTANPIVNKVTPSIYFQHPNITKGTYPASALYYPMVEAQQNGGTGTATRMGLLQCAVRETGIVETVLYAYENKASSTATAALGVYYNPVNGEKYALAPTPSNAADSSQRIATTAWVNARITALAGGGPFVSTTGNQTVAGTKTFTSVPVVQGTGPAFKLVKTNVTKGTTPASNMNTNMLQLVDSANVVMSLIYSSYQTNGNIMTGMYSCNPNGTDNTSLQIVFAANGEKYGVAPTPQNAADNSTRIATTAWVNTRINTITQSTAQTINAIKTFTANQIISKVDPSIEYIHPNISKGGTFGSSCWWVFGAAYSKEGNSTLNNRMGSVETVWITGEDAVQTQLLAYQPIAGTQNTASMGVRYNKDGTQVAWAPAPNAAASGNEIATTGWVRNLINASAGNSYHIKAIYYNNNNRIFVLPTGGTYQVVVWLFNRNDNLGVVSWSYHSVFEYAGGTKVTIVSGYSGGLILYFRIL